MVKKYHTTLVVRFNDVENRDALVRLHLVLMQNKGEVPFFLLGCEEYYLEVDDSQFCGRYGKHILQDILGKNYRIP